MQELIDAFIKSFVPLFAIMDPFISVPVFIAMTRGMSKEQKNEVAKEAATVAGIVLFIFLLFGKPILQTLGISMSAFSVGGGLVLLLMGLQLVLGFKLNGDNASSQTSAGVIIGTPLITGPGVITTSILLSNQYAASPLSFAGLILAALFAIFLTWAIIRNSHHVQKMLSDQGVTIFSRVMGLLLTATGVQFLAKGGLFALA